MADGVDFVESSLDQPIRNPNFVETEAQRIKRKIKEWSEYIGKNNNNIKSATAASDDKKSA